MPTKRLHDKPFDQTTLAKLTIFESYAQVWIAIWIMTRVPEIHIFDLFAGPGYDSGDTSGSPIRLLEKLNEQIAHIESKRVSIAVHLNEFEPKVKVQKNYELLRAAVELFLNEHRPLQARIQVLFYNEDFEQLFPKLLPLVRQFPSLVLLDQNGIKFLSPEILHEFARMKQTDFLCFAAASFFRRFADQPDFKKHVALDGDRLAKVPYNLIHREVVQQLRERLPDRTELRLYPYSLLKGSNIYGLIFGATHPLAVDKFLEVAWKLDPLSGDANFDIENEEAKLQGNLFEPNLTKREVFEAAIQGKILHSEITTNREALEFCYSEGHPANHGREAVVKLKKEGYVSYEGPSPLINYEQVYRNKRTLNYTVLKR